MRFLVVVFSLLFPFAASADLDQAIDAYNMDNYEDSATLARAALGGELSDEDALTAREILLISEYYLGRTGADFLREMQAADRDMIGVHGRDATERLSLLFAISDLRYQLGQVRDAIHADVQIARIALKDSDSTEDLLWAVRNMAVAFDQDPEPRTSVYYTTLFEFFAIDFHGRDDPLAQEATAMAALALLRADQPARAAQKFLTHSMESWQAFAGIGPDEDALTAELFDALDTLQIDDEEAWFAAIQKEFDADLERERLITEISDLLEKGQFDFASPHYAEALEKMNLYLQSAYPEDPVVAFYLNMILKSHLEAGDFEGARPYLAGVLTYPSPYAATLDMPIGTVAAVLAGRGGIDDDLLEPLVRKAMEIEEIVPSDDPEMLFDFFYALGQIKDRQGDRAAAFAAYRQALDLSERADGLPFRYLGQTLNAAGLALSALGRDDEARPYQQQMLENARNDGDLPAASAALSALSQIALKLGENSVARDLAHEKLALEKDRVPRDDGAVRTAQMNLALILLSQSGAYTPELADLLPDILSASPADPEVADIQSAMMILIAERLGSTPDTVRNHPVFQATSASQKAQLVAVFAQAAIAQSAIDDAKDWIDLGYELAVSPSREFLRLKQVEGQIALSENRAADALVAFRTISDHQQQTPFQNEDGEFSHVPYHMAAALQLASDPAIGQDLRFQGEAFLLAQLASSTAAGRALNTAIARDQADSETRKFLKDRERLLRDISTIEAAIEQALYDGKSADRFRSRKAQLAEELGTLNEAIARAAPDLARITDIKPLAMADVARLLRPDEVLAIYVTSDATLPDGSPASFLVSLSQDSVLLTELPARADLSALSTELRCSAALTDPNCANAGGDGTRGSFGKPANATAAGPVFRTELAYRAYQALIAPMARMLDGRKRLIIVPDRALVSLPFHLMLRTPLPEGRPLNEGHWLIRDQSIEIAPTVASFVAMRLKDQSASSGAFLGVGDPLIGVQRNGQISFNCDEPSPETSIVASLVPEALKRSSGLERTRLVADLTALPDTRCELQKIAGLFEHSTLLLQDKASETALKSMSKAGDLRDFSVVNFATHGLIAGEIGVNDSGLVLSPPAIATAGDDGLLTTSEIADLDLDADFVILSACNTASGDSRNDEGLSGMAGAFFLAGARSLMVSHWPVYSDAAVDLTTRTFDTLGKNPDMARADAIRMAMLSILDDPAATPRMRHPAYWGPFMIVGDGLGSTKHQ